MRERMIEMIDRETENKNAGKEGRIIVKINSLTDDRDYSRALSGVAGGRLD
jgi:polyphosphate kinase